jgi:hypothetical protein
MEDKCKSCVRRKYFKWFKPVEKFCKAWNQMTDFNKAYKMMTGYCVLYEPNEEVRVMEREW